MTDSEMHDIISRLALAYPSCPTATSPKRLTEVKHLYLEFWGTEPFCRMKRVVDQLIRTSKFWPTVSEINDLMRGGIAGPTHEAIPEEESRRLLDAHLANLPRSEDLPPVPVVPDGAFGLSRVHVRLPGGVA